MAIPDYQTCMLPFLRLLGDGQEHALRDAEEALAANFKLTETERAELLPSGQQGIFKNRIGWARTHLKKAGLLGACRAWGVDQREAAPARTVFAGFAGP